MSKTRKPIVIDAPDGAPDADGATGPDAESRAVAAHPEFRALLEESRRRSAGGDRGRPAEDVFRELGLADGDSAAAGAGEQERGWWSGAEDVRERTAAACPDAVALWLDGINRAKTLLTAIDGGSLSTDSDDHAQELVIVALLTHAVNTQTSGYMLASGGLYWQALPLARVGHEAAVAGWYCLEFPRSAKLLLRGKAVIERMLLPKEGRDKTQIPHYDHMVDKLEAKHHRRFERLRQTYDWLNVFAHTGPLSVLWSLDANEDAVEARLGPRFERRLFEACTMAFTRSLSTVIAIAEDVVKHYGGQPAVQNEASVYEQAVEAWVQTLKTADTSATAG